MTTLEEPLRCDYCNDPVYVAGVETPHYTHVHGAVFCHPTTATVNGRVVPPNTHRNRVDDDR